MTLRDDIVFFVFLYQWGAWHRKRCDVMYSSYMYLHLKYIRQQREELLVRRYIYKVDPSRPDEFGFAGCPFWSC